MQAMRYLTVIGFLMYGASFSVTAYGQIDTSGTTATSGSRTTSPRPVGSVLAPQNPADFLPQYEKRCTNFLAQTDLADTISVAGKFTILKQNRQKIAQYSQQANSDRDFYKQRIEQGGSFVTPQVAFAIPDVVTSELDMNRDPERERDLLQSAVTNLTEELRVATSAPGVAPQHISNLRARKADLETSLAITKRFIERRDASRKQATEYRQRIEDIEKRDNWISASCKI